MAEHQLDLRKTGKVLIARTNRAFLPGGFKERQLEILPSMLSFKRKSQHDCTMFLLAPLGYIEIVQIKEDILVLVSKFKREGQELRKFSERLMGTGCDLFVKQLTLKFQSREEREDWMKAIIAECDRNYLTDLLDDQIMCTPKFIVQTNEEIWKRILSEKGDEALRYAYIAARGSAHFDVVRLIVSITVEWIQKLLGITGPLKSHHKKPFTTLLSLLVEDNCARVFFFLLRPEPKFLEIFREDSGVGFNEHIEKSDKQHLTPDQITAMEMSSVCLGLIKLFKERMQDASWKKFRFFLSIVEHPSIPTLVEERYCSYTEELAWMRWRAADTSVIDWFMAKNALKDAPYLSYYFIRRVIENVIDDQKILKVLLLIDRVPPDQKDMFFEVDRVAWPLRKHFIALKDYCKFREMWKHFNVDHSKNKEFFETVHMEIWTRIALNDDAVLIKMFLPTEISQDELPSFAVVLAGEIVRSTDGALLSSLGITQKPVEAGERPVSAYDAQYLIEAFRVFVIERLTLWVWAILSTERVDLNAKEISLKAKDAALYVDLLVAAAKSSIVRAVLWLVLPVSTTERSAEGFGEFPADPLAFCGQFLSVLEELTQIRSKSERFLSFLTLAEHPLGVSLTTTSAADACIVHDQSSQFSKAHAIKWMTEAKWMNEVGFQKWRLSWSELKLVLSDTPYFAFQILIRRFNKDGIRYHNLLQVVKSLPSCIVETSFEADIDMCGGGNFGSKDHLRTALHFREFVASRKVIELWNSFQTDIVFFTKGFKEEVQNQLLFLLVAQRNGNDRINGFHRMMSNISTLSTVDVNSDAMVFESIIPMLLKNRLNSDDELRALFPEISESKCEPLDDASRQFLRYVEYIADFCRKFYFGKELTVKMSAGFAKVLSACLYSMTVRAVLMLMDPLSWDQVTTSANNMTHVRNPTARLSEVVNFLHSNQNHSLILYLLKMLEHPGIHDKNNVLSVMAVPWMAESEWLWKTKHMVSLAFDEVDFTLLGNPAYLLFRYICRHFHRIDDEVIHSTMDEVMQLPPGIEEDAFQAKLNYFPCSNNVVIEPVAAPHFAYLRKYFLFHKLWRIQLKCLLDPKLDQSFQDAVTFKLWTLVSGKANHKLINIFAPSNSSIDWDERETYFVVLQRFAILKMLKADVKILPKLCPGFSPPTPEPELNETVIDAHHTLIGCILRWMHQLLDYTPHLQSCFLEGRQTLTSDQRAALFVEFIILCFNDVAMRCLVTAFIPSPSSVEGFMNSTFYKGQKSVEAFPTAAVQFIQLLARTLRDQDWMEFRSFMNVLKHPVVNGGMCSEQLPLWSEEAEWITDRQQIKPALVSWQEFNYLCTNSAYVLLLSITKGLPSPEMQSEALRVIPAKYLVSRLNADFVTSPNRNGVAPHFVAIFLNDSTNNLALKVFQERGMISDGFFEAVLNEAYVDINSPCLLQVYNLLKIVFFRNDKSSAVWNVEMLELVPNLSSVLITFLHKIGTQKHFKRDEMIIGCIIMLVLQLEAYKYENTGRNKNEQKIVKAYTVASEWMRTDKYFVTTFFDMLQDSQFTKWFARLCVNFNSHFGKAEAPLKDPPDFEMDVYYENVSTVDDVLLNESMQLTKNKLCLSILGYFNLCVEFRPEVFHEFIMGLGHGRPFFSYFMHKYEMLSDSILQSLCRILDVQSGSLLQKRIMERMLFYDNDHSMPTVIQTMGLRRTGASSNLTDSEFTDLLCVAQYTHDLKDLKSRFENVVVSVIGDQERREMTHKVLKWIVEYFVMKDTYTEHQPTHTEAINRVKWKQCVRFEGVAFEDVIECAAEAKKATDLLRSASRSTYGVLEKLFEHYITQRSPRLWILLFKESKTIAYFLKYVDVEDLCLAYDKFFALNERNNCFKNHLLRVRRLLKKSVVSCQELVQLTSARGSDEKSFNQFFANLNRIAKGDAKADKKDLAMIYRLTAAWMKISMEKILFPLPLRNVQVITLLTVAAWARDLLHNKKKDIGKALIAQVDSGEGKSLVIAMTAIYCVVVLNKKVHILESSRDLLEKKVVTMAPLYAQFDIERRLEGQASEKKRDLTFTTEEGLHKDARREFAKFGITYTLRRNVERYYQDCIMHGITEPLKDTILIVDEVDELFLDDCPNQPYATSDCEAAEFHRACAHFKTSDDLPDEKMDSFVWELAQITKESAGYMMQNEHYQARGSSYERLEDEPGHKGVVNCYDYRLEYLKFAHFGTQPNFKSTFYFQSMPYMLQQYSAITGFSGSLGSPSEREFLREQYKVWCFDTPPFLNTCTNVRKVPAQLMEDPECKSGCVHVYPNSKQQIDKIISIALANYRKVPVLIIARSTAEAYAINDLLIEAVKKDNLAPGDYVSKYLQMFMQYKKHTRVLDNQNWARIVQRATAKKREEDRFCITVTDPFGGRGHDFDVNDDEVDQRGGLAVIMSSIPTSERELRQWKGRTARKENHGQYAMVLCEKDSPINKSPHILKNFEHKREYNGQPIPFCYKEDVINKLLELQDEDQMKKLRQLKAEIAMGKRLNRLCDQFYAKYEKMSEESWPRGEPQKALRDLLTRPEYMMTSVTIDLAFETLGLTEHDIRSPQVIPPDVTSSAFWNAEEQHQEEWDYLKTEHEKQQKDLSQSTEDTKLQAQKEDVTQSLPPPIFEEPLTPHTNTQPLSVTVPKPKGCRPLSFCRLPAVEAHAKESDLVEEMYDTAEMEAVVQFDSSVVVASVTQAAVSNVQVVAKMPLMKDSEWELSVDQDQRLLDPAVDGGTVELGNSIDNGCRLECSGSSSYNCELVRRGNGSFLYSNGAKYEGQIENDEFHGHGTYRSADGDVYVGQWRRGARHGVGTARYSSGAVYEGEWDNDRRSGRGIAIYADGNVYRGEWKDDKRHGFGMYRNAHGILFNGQWQNDVRFIE